MFLLFSPADAHAFGVVGCVVVMVLVAGARASRTLFFVSYVRARAKGAWNGSLLALLCWANAARTPVRLTTPFSRPVTVNRARLTDERRTKSNELHGFFVQQRRARPVCCEIVSQRVRVCHSGQRGKPRICPWLSAALPPVSRTTSAATGGENSAQVSSLHRPVAVNVLLGRPPDHGYQKCWIRTCWCTQKCSFRGGDSQTHPFHLLSQEPSNTTR